MTPEEEKAITDKLASIMRAAENDPYDGWHFDFEGEQVWFVQCTVGIPIGATPEDDNSVPDELLDEVHMSVAAHEAHCWRVERLAPTKIVALQRALIDLRFRYETTNMTQDDFDAEYGLILAMHG